MISSLQRKQQQNFWLALIPHVKVVCDKFKCTANQYNMNTLLKHKIYSQDFVYESKIKSKSTQMAHCTYSFPSKCGTNYLRQTGKPLSMNCLKHRLNLKKGYFGKPIFVQHAYESLQVQCIAAKTLHTDSNTYEISTNSMMRKCHQSSLGFSHVQSPLIPRK